MENTACPSAANIDVGVSKENSGCRHCHIFSLAPSSYISVEPITLGKQTAVLFRCGEAFQIENIDDSSLEFSNQWIVSLYAKNVADEEVEYDAIASVQDPLAAMSARPRTIGLAVRKDF